jgi:hypothetical protein
MKFHSFLRYPRCNRKHENTHPVAFDLFSRAEIGSSGGGRGLSTPGVVFSRGGVGLPGVGVSRSRAGSGLSTLGESPSRHRKGLSRLGA